MTNYDIHNSEQKSLPETGAAKENKRDPAVFLLTDNLPVKPISGRCMLSCFSVLLY